MASRLPLALVALASALRVTAMDPFTFCKDDQCGDCPVSVTSLGTGFPDCAIYSSKDVFGNQGFPQKDNVIQAHLAVPQLDEQAPCYLIFKSPASTTMPGCGETQKFFQDETCGTVNLKETFMVQFCCGTGDCSAAGIPAQTGGKRSQLLTRSAKFGPGISAGDIEFLSARSGGSGIQSMRIAVNGTEIEPLYVGPPQVSATTGDVASRTVEARSEESTKGVCKGDWTPDAGYEDYTRPADGPQILSDLLSGPLAYTITKTRSQTWTQTTEESLGFADILSLGVSFSKSFSKSLMNAESVQYTVAEGDTGYIAWTSFLRCSQGSGTCNGKKVTGEVCTPYNDANSGKLAGQYSIVMSG
ncbi:hypothetical protein F5Y12DRAFT_374696 [Xylaria sp. FL1777]|nr:hypothetical protein F5Y12DRAFT_374696 [Xylaria sp. FL1777]